MIYYPVPAHRQKMFDAFGGSNYQLPVTDWLNRKGDFTYPYIPNWMKNNRLLL